MDFLPQLANTTKQQKLFIAKVRANYVTVIEGELKLTQNPLLPIAFESIDELKSFISKNTSEGLSSATNYKSRVIASDYKVHVIELRNK